MLTNGYLLQIRRGSPILTKNELSRIRLVVGFLAALRALGLEGGSANTAGDDRDIAMPPLQIVATSFRVMGENDPGSIRVVIRNQSTRPRQLREIWVNGRAQALLPPETCLEVKQQQIAKTKNGELWDMLPPSSAPGNVLWTWKSSSSIDGPGAVEIIIQFASRPISSVQIRFVLEKGEDVLVDVPLQQSLLRLCGANFSRQLDFLYVYVSNTSTAKLRITQAGLLPHKMYRTDELMLLPGGLQCIKLDTSACKWGERVYPWLESDDGSRIAFSVLAVSGFPFEVEGVAEPQVSSDLDQIHLLDLLEHYSQYSYRQDVVAAEIIQKLTESANPTGLPGGTIPSAKFVQGTAPNCTKFLGKLIPLTKICCDPLSARYLFPYSPGSWHYQQAKATYFRERTVPNRCWLGMRAFHGYGGSCNRTMTPDEIRFGAYYLVSSGSKGIFFRTGRRSWYKQQNDLRENNVRELSRLRVELLAMRSLLNIAEPTFGVASCTEPLVEPACLLAGDRAIIMILLNRDRTSAWPSPPRFNKEDFWLVPKSDPFDVVVQLPQGISPSDILEIDSELLWKLDYHQDTTGVVSFRCNKLQATKQYVICFNSQVKEQIRKDHLRARKDWGDGASVNAFIDELILPPTPAGSGVEKGQGPRKSAGVPDIQLWPKQLHWGTVDPSQHSMVRDVHVRNVGSADLDITVETNPPGVNIEPEHVKLRSGEQSQFRVIFLPKDAKNRSFKTKIALYTNDPNEGKVFLDLAAIIRPEVMVDRDRIILGGERECLLHLRDLTGRNLILESIESTVPGVLWDLEIRDSNPIKKPSKICQDDRSERLLILTLKYSPTTEFTLGAKGKLKIRTNNDLYREISIPVEIPPPPPAFYVMPEKLFFGLVTVGQRATQTCVLRHTGKMHIVDILISDPSITVGTARAAATESMFDVTVCPEKPGRYREIVSIKLRHHDEEITVDVPIVLLAVE